MDDPVLRPAAVARALGIKKTALYAWVKKGLLPKPVRYGPRATGWRKSIIDAYLAAREAVAASEEAE